MMGTSFLEPVLEAITYHHNCVVQPGLFRLYLAEQHNYGVFMAEKIIGRGKEQQILRDKMNSPSAEFIAVYGRRRVGKTFLIKQFFEQKNDLFFEQTGLKDGALQEQLPVFSDCLSKAFYGGVKIAIPKNWMEALRELTTAIDSISKSKRIILFFDEVPWLASQKSGFLKALDFFWNTEWSHRKKLVLIVCGSAASWMMENLIYAKGGLHNRITAKISLQPFNLRETEEYLKYLNVSLNRQQILQLYMVTGGIPHYLKSVKRGLSSSQNINELCFQKGGLLFDEFDLLFHSLFDDPEVHIDIIRAIADRPKGIDRELLIRATKSSNGGSLSNRIRSLEEAGFVSSFLPLHHARRGIHYRIVDEYSLFYLTWIEPLRKRSKGAITHAHYWEAMIKKHHWLAWAGLSFEAVCFKHTEAIRKKLGIENVSTICSDWRYQSGKGGSDLGAQIDLVFDREDGCTTLCEIKYTEKPFVLTKEFIERIKTKEAIYREKTRTQKQIFWALIAANGTTNSQRADNLICHVITADDLFST